MAASSQTPDSRVPDLTAGLAIALLAGGATWRLTGLPASYALLVAGLYAVLATIVGLRLPENAPGPGIGRANRVTLGRAALAVPIVALSPYAAAFGSVAWWWVIGLSTTVMILDGVDGRIARRSGTQTPFGARFDMEVDAALLLGLSALVWQSGKVGAWVLLIGGMRYLFVGASRIWPALATPLPPSLRRQGVCVVQGVVLLVALGPFVPSWMAVVVTAAGLAALMYSFGVDVWWALVMSAGQGDAAALVGNGSSGRGSASEARSNTSSR